MGKLCMVLPPFSPDYSGVCSALFPLNSLTVIHDGAGCTGNYTGYDEPRWFHSKSPIFCSGLREIDAILGDDEKLVQKILSALETVKPELIALVGSPVPMVIGADMEGIAADIESRTGIKSFGFSTTGLKYYPQGIEQVDQKIVRRILEESEVVPQTRPNSFNILGATPLDFGKTGTIEDLEQLLAEHGYERNTVFWSCNSIAQIEHSVHAACNIVVSAAGFWLANYMKQKYGIPYVDGLPYGEKYSRVWLEKLGQCMRQETNQNAVQQDVNQNAVQQDANQNAVRQEANRNAVQQDAKQEANQPASGEQGVQAEEKGTASESAAQEESTVLIIGEQIQSSSLREALKHQYGLNADVAGICGWNEACAKAQDRFMETEADIEDMLNQEKYQLIIGDILYKELLHSDKRLIPYNHYAVSSKLGTDSSYSLIGEKLEQLNILENRERK